MKVFNTTTGTEIDLTIIDRPTGTEWTSDLVGNADELVYNDEKERYEMAQDDIDWWANTIAGLNKIEDLTEEAKELIDEDDFEALQEQLSQEGNPSDYEQHIAVLTQILNDVIEANK
jgi:hypothetical protein